MQCSYAHVNQCNRLLQSSIYCKLNIQRASNVCDDNSLQVNCCHVSNLLLKLLYSTNTNSKVSYLSVLCHGSIQLQHFLPWGFPFWGVNPHPSHHLATLYQMWDSNVSTASCNELLCPKEIDKKKVWLKGTNETLNH